MGWKIYKYINGNGKGKDDINKNKKQKNEWIFEKNYDQIILDHVKRKNKRNAIVLSLIDILMSFILVIVLMYIFHFNINDSLYITAVVETIVVTLLSLWTIIRLKRKYWIMILVPLIALGSVALLIMIYPNNNDVGIGKGEILSFSGDYLTFVGAFCLGYFIYLRDEERLKEEKRIRVKLLMSTMDKAENLLGQLTNQVNESENENNVSIDIIQYDTSWSQYYYDYEKLTKANNDLKKAINRYFNMLDLVNMELRKKQYKKAVHRYQNYIEKEQYSIYKYNFFDIGLCLLNACYDYPVTNTTSWLENKKNIDQINDLCQKYYYIIENHIYVWMLQHNLNIIDNGYELMKNTTDWLIENSEEINHIARLMNKRMIYRVVYNCSCMMQEKSTKVGYVWGEYSLR